MRVSKKNISFGIKLSKNFQSVDCSESIELEFSDDEKIDYEIIDCMFHDMMERVIKIAKTKLEEITVTEKQQEDIKLVM